MGSDAPEKATMTLNLSRQEMAVLETLAQGGTATIYGWTWIGFQREADMQRFDAVWFPLPGISASTSEGEQR